MLPCFVYVCGPSGQGMGVGDGEGSGEAEVMGDMLGLFHFNGIFLAISTTFKKPT